MLSSIFLSALRWLCLILLGNEHICFACCNRPLHIAIWKYAGNIHILLFLIKKRHVRKLEVHVFHASISDRNVSWKRVYIHIHTLTHAHTHIPSPTTYKPSATGLAWNYHFCVILVSLTQIKMAQSICNKHIWSIIWLLPCDCSFGEGWNRKMSTAD